MYSISKMYMYGYKYARSSSKSSIIFSGSPARLPFPTECINFISLGAKFVIVNYWLQKGLRLVYLRKIISVLVSILSIISCLTIFSKIVAV